MRRIVTAVVVAAVCALPACSGDAHDPEDARVQAPNGAIQVRRASGTSWVTSGSTDLSPGDRVRVRGTGRVVAVLPGDATVELRRGAVLVHDRTPRLEGGAALVRTRRRTVRVAASPATVRVASGSAVRLSRGFGVDVAVYEGSASVASLGRSRVLRALRQGTVSGPGLLPDRPLPIQYSASDDWDRRFLLEAIEVGRELTARSRGLTAQLGSSSPGAGFYRLSLPELDDQPAFDDALLASVTADRAAPGEVLVGAAITSAGRRGSFASRWREVFAFRADGAEWGIVALDQGVTDGSGLVERLDVALGRALDQPVEVAAPARPARPSGAPQRAPGAAGAPTPTTPRGGSGSPPPTTAPTTTTTTPPFLIAPPPPDTGTGADPVIGALLGGLVDAVNDVVGGLLDPPPPGTPAAP